MWLVADTPHLARGTSLSAFQGQDHTAGQPASVPWREDRRHTRVVSSSTERGRTLADGPHGGGSSRPRWSLG